VVNFLNKERSKECYDKPKNLEEKAISLVGRPLYEAFIRGYTIKQWEKDPKELSADIITRLPVRHNYVNGYFKDKYEGIPLNGYGSVFENIIDHPRIKVRLNSDYFNLRNEIGDTPTLYTGPIDRYFDFKHGHLDWRTIDFEKQIHDVEDFQGCSIMNYADEAIKYTRIHEFKHLHPERNSIGHTLTFKEYSRVAGKVDEPYYPVNTPRNSKLLKLYQDEIKEVKNVLFGGRLGSYRYFDMEATIGYALELSDKIIDRHKNN
jgi:UDP-galactopyranose mutase